MSLNFLVGLFIGGIIPSIIAVYFYNHSKRNSELMLRLLRETVIELDARDPYFNGHTRRVSKLSHEIGKKFKFSNKRLFELELAVYLTEIGKIRIPDSILVKRERLTEQEFNVIKKHPIIAYKMIENINSLGKVANIVKAHHEKYNGEGYPDKLFGKNIPLESRIISLADSYDAMTSKRPYKEALSENEAIDEILKQREVQFDPEVVDYFIEALKS